MVRQCYLCGMLFEKLWERQLLESAPIPGVPSVQLFGRLSSGEEDALGIRHDDMVAAIGSRMVDWLVLAYSFAALSQAGPCLGGLARCGWQCGQGGPPMHRRGAKDDNRRARSRPS